MTKSRLLLVSANQCTVPYPVYPLGVSYLHTYLSEKMPGLDVRVFDFNLGSEEDLIAVLREYRPDFTGISLRNVDDVDSLSRHWFLRDYRNIAQLIRDTVTTRIIIGGSAFSIFPEKIFDYIHADFGIYGEGEESLVQLLSCLEDGQDYAGIEGLVYRTDGDIRINSRKTFLHTLDLDFEEEFIDYYWEKSGMMNVQTKRGCPHRCIYCTYPIIEGTRVRTLDPDRIIETLWRLYHEKNIDYIFFTDSVFNIRDDFNRELAEKIIRRGLQIKWGAYFSPHGLDREMLTLYKSAGLTHIEFGTESLSDATLKHYGKHFTVAEVKEVSDLCNEVDIYYSHFMILGGYGETQESILEGFENSKQFENTVFFPYIGMRIYPGTRLHALALQEGYIGPEEDLLEPVYYLANGIDYTALKSQAEATGRRWVFSDEDVVTVMNKMRKRNRKGSLWHHLKK
jgi:radical SAM superfamily enzyme YgiQ (UPF0313 family)